MFEFIVREDSPVLGKSLADLKMSSELLVTMIRRKDRMIQPRGATVIEIGDGMTVMGNIKELLAFANVNFPEEYKELVTLTDTERKFTLTPILSRKTNSERFFGGSNR